MPSISPDTLSIPLPGLPDKLTEPGGKIVTNPWSTVDYQEGREGRMPGRWTRFIGLTCRYLALDWDR